MPTLITCLRSTQSGSDKPHICREIVEGRPCLSSFKRKADFQRHMICVHHNKDTSKIWYCDAPHCDRNSIGAQGGFTQKDHLTEHLRSYHHRDIPKTRGRGLEDDQPESSTAQQRWMTIAMYVPESDLARVWSITITVGIWTNFLKHTMFIV